MKIPVYANGCRALLALLRKALAAQLRVLGLPTNRIEMVTPSVEVTATAPLVLYLATSECGAPQGIWPADGLPVPPELTEYLATGQPLLPVVDALETVFDVLPEELRAYNAIDVSARTDGTAPPIERILHHILDCVWHARRERKVFLSYKRSDSTKIAYQLRDALQKEHYTVFLDECSIEPAVHFQRELEGWLNDADLVLLLRSPNVHLSRWVEREIDQAHLLKVGLLAVQWPSQTDTATWLDERFSLDESDFATATSAGAGAELHAATIRHIVAQVGRVRVAAMHRRVENLLPLVHEQLIANAMRVRSQKRFGDLRISGGTPVRRHHLRLVPFRPQMPSFFDLANDLGPARLDGAGCVYFENDARHPHASVVDWALGDRRSRTGPRRFFRAPVLDGKLLLP